MKAPHIYYARYNPSSAEDLPHFEHDLGRSLLRLGLDDYAGICLSLHDLEAKIRTADRKKPCFPDGWPHFNISHCPGLAACVISREPAGLDVEKIRPFRDGILRRVLSPDEREDFDLFAARFPEKRTERFIRYWTLKESYVKYTGEGLGAPLTAVTFTFPEEEPLSDPSHPASVPPSCDNRTAVPGGLYCRPAASRRDLSFFQKKLSACHILSLCTPSEIPPQDTDLSFLTDSKG